MIAFLVRSRDNSPAFYTCRSSTLISQQERVEDDAEYEITGSKMTRNMK